MDSRGRIAQVSGDSEADVRISQGEGSTAVGIETAESDQILSQSGDEGISHIVQIDHNTTGIERECSRHNNGGVGRIYPGGSRIEIQDGVAAYTAAKSETGDGQGAVGAVIQADASGVRCRRAADYGDCR